jgi:tetratricopeptide (TPR) repeat protein
MQVALLPMNAGPGTRATLARQISQFVAEVARNLTGKEIHGVNFMAQYDDGGVTRFAQANPSEGLNEPEMLRQFFDGAPMDAIVDGLLVESEGSGGNLTARIFRRGGDGPEQEESVAYLPGGFLAAARGLLKLACEASGAPLPSGIEDDVAIFGTHDSGAFTNFLVGFDAVQYIERSQGAVAREFDPGAGLDALMAAREADPDWEAPYMAAVRLCRACIQHRLGDAEKVRATLDALAAAEPDDPRAFFALGELDSTVGNVNAAVDMFEKAAAALERQTASLEADEASASGAEKEAAAAALEGARADLPNILARLAVEQAKIGMPANAERNLRRAVELEAEPKPATELLANLLASTGRGHEVPGLWRERAAANPKSGEVQAKYAAALIAAGQTAEGLRAFDDALGSVEDPFPVKRMYAGALAAQGEHDRAMDLFEDCLDASPADVPLLLDYASTLQAAGREFEVPKVLRDVLSANPDQNVRAQTQAWLIELEQPKRVEAVKNAADKAQSGDPGAAVTELRGLKNWLADYWKFWAVYASALNQSGEHKEAEEAGVRLLNLFPSCEPAFGELATALSGQGRHEEAYNFLRNAISGMPGSLMVAVNLALAAKRSGREDEAVALGRQIKAAAQGVQGLDEVFAELGV